MPDTWPELLESVSAFEPPDDLRVRVEQRRSYEAAAAPWRRHASRWLIGAIAATAGVAAVILMLVLAAHSHAPTPHAVASQAQAISIAKRDGYNVQLGSPGIHPLTCTSRGLAFGTIQPGTPQVAGTILPRYVVSITDHKLHPLRDGSNGPTTGGILLLLALPSAADAKRCAAAGIYTAQHQPTSSPSTQGQNPVPTTPYRMFSPVTVDINPHSPNAAGFIPGTTGQFDTYMAQGHVLAIGQTYNEAQATIAEADLRQLLSQIAD
jgi:hypothetical protein